MSDENVVQKGSNTSVILDGVGALDDWMKGRPKPQVRRSTDHVRVIRMIGESNQGNNGVAICAKLRDGSVAMIALTERSFLMAAQAIGAASTRDGTIAPDLLTAGDIRLGDGSTPEELERVRAWCESTIDDINKRLAGPKP